MGKRFAVVIGVVAVGLMALGAQTAIAQTAAQPPAVVKYDTKLWITHEACCTGRTALWHGGLESDRTECMGGRRVILFKEQRGADRKLGTDRSHFHPDYGDGGWGLRAPVDGRVYARVTPKVGDGFVCRADRSRTIKNGDLCFEDPSFCGPRPKPGEGPQTGPPTLDTTLTSFTKNTRSLARFAFTANRPGATFECAVDPSRPGGRYHQPFHPCTSPFRVRVGYHPPRKHVFAVRATVGGVTDATPARVTWTIVR